jgi:glycosyltransferase involved in cell wall biosynthesis
MPTYNGERFLRPAIESILAQTFTAFELIVIDDGSTDATPQILASFHDPRIVLLANPRNLGIAASTNRGLAAARGEFIALHDHDDISLPHRFQTQLDFLNSHPDIALVGSAATLIDDNSIPYAEFPLPCEEIDIKWRLLFVGDAFHYTSAMVRRHAFTEIGGYGEDPAFRYAEVYDPFSRLAMRHRVANLPQNLVLWRRHSGATSLRHTQRQLESAEVISLNQIATLAQSIRKPARALDHRYLLSGFKAFTSTYEGQLPVLPAEQLIAGLNFFCDIQNAFYRLHRFPRSAIARHRRTPNYVWGKHAFALAVRAPWSLASRIKIIVLGLRCLWHAASSTLTDTVLTVFHRAAPHPRITAPTIEPIDHPEQPSCTKNP